MELRSFYGGDEPLGSLYRDVLNNNDLHDKREEKLVSHLVHTIINDKIKPEVYDKGKDFWRLEETGINIDKLNEIYRFFGEEKVNNNSDTLEYKTNTNCLNSYTEIFLSSTTYNTRSKAYTINTNLTDDDLLQMLFITDIREKVFEMLEDEDFECLYFQPENDIHKNIIKIYIKN